VKQLLLKYNRPIGAATMLVIIYAIHLFTFHALLSNPNDFLTASSFGEYQTKPKQANNFLLLLAKQQIAKQSTSAEKQLDLLPCISADYFAFTPHLCAFTPKFLPRLWSYSYKRYCLVCVLRI
jgi:hypothetical protein